MNNDFENKSMTTKLLKRYKFKINIISIYYL